MKLFLKAVSVVVMALSGGVLNSSAGDMEAARELSFAKPSVNSDVSIPVVREPAVTDEKPGEKEFARQNNTGKLMPDALYCEKIRCYDIMPPVNDSSWCQDDTLKSVTLTSLNKMPLYLGGDKPVSGAIHLDEAKNIIIDFAPPGDQYSFFTFPSAGLEELYLGNQTEVKGTYTDAFDWDGYHERFKVDFTCRSKSL